MCSPSIPKPKTPPPPPEPIDEALLERRRSSKRQRSLRTDTLLTGPGGVSDRATLSAPTLVGSGSGGMG